MAAPTTERHLKAPWADGLLEWESATPLKVTAGRGTLWRIRHPAGDLVERPYRHGGLRRLVLPALFWRSDRPANEYDIHRQLFQCGLPTLEPVGWAERRASLPGCRYFCYYTVYLDGAVPLPTALIRGLSRPTRLAHEGAALLAHLHREAIVHRDLNLNNWLVHQGRLLLIDFDKAVRLRVPAKAFLTAALARLARSGVKLGLENHRLLFFRLAIASARALNLPPRAVLTAIPRRHSQRRFYHRLRWWLSGGHRHSG